MRVLGFSVGHDKGAVLIEDGKVIIGITGAINLIVMMHSIVINY
jgi:hypothetical protein